MGKEPAGSHPKGYVLPHVLASSPPSGESSEHVWRIPGGPMPAIDDLDGMADVLARHMAIAAGAMALIGGGPATGAGMERVSNLYPTEPYALSGQIHEEAMYVAGEALDMGSAAVEGLPADLWAAYDRIYDRFAAAGPDDPDLARMAGLARAHVAEMLVAAPKGP